MFCNLLHTNCEHFNWIHGQCNKQGFCNAQSITPVPGADVMLTIKVQNDEIIEQNRAILSLLRDTKTRGER